MKPKTKIVLIGAGSAVFGTRLVMDIARTKGLHGSHLVLVDLNEEKLNVVYKIGRRIVEETGADLVLSTSTDYKQVLPDANYVITTVAQGGVDAWLDDVQIPRKFGYNFAVADTMGPGGMGRALRTIPIVLEIAKQMEQSCPKALLINYSNPMTAICRAVAKYTTTQVIGLCHGLQNTVRRIAPRLGYKPNELQAWGAGINHQIWLTHIIDSLGNDVYPKLIQRAQENPEEQPLAYHLFNLYGLFPSGGDDHIVEFFPSFAAEDHGKKYNIELNYVEKVIEYQNKEYAELKALSNNANIKVSDYMHGNAESAAEIMDCLTNGKTGIFMVNIPNNDKLPGLPNEAIVEIPGVPTPAGVLGLQVPPLPVGITGRLLTNINEFELVVDAAVLRRRDLAIQAMLANSGTLSSEKATQVTDAILLANIPYIGSFN